MFIIRRIFKCHLSRFCFNCYSSFTLFRVRNNDCTIYLNNRDLQTTINLFTRNVSSHTTVWTHFELPLPALSCLLYRRASSVMNALEGERLPSRNIYKCKRVILLLVFVYFLYVYRVVNACLLVYPFFYTTLLLSPVYFFIPFLYWCCC